MTPTIWNHTLHNIEWYTGHLRSYCQTTGYAVQWLPNDSNAIEGLDCGYGKPSIHSRLPIMTEGVRRRVSNSVITAREKDYWGIDAAGNILKRTIEQHTAY